MREIKFRAWDGKKMEVFEHNITEPYYNVGLGAFLLKHYDSNIMQYTGLKNKNGKEIYEGDIVLGDEGDRFVVFYDSGTASFSLEFLKNRKMRDSFLDDSEEYEIIGNIYENPELLEEK